MPATKICKLYKYETFAECRMCINSPNKIAAECAQISRDDDLETYNRKFTRKGAKAKAAS